MILALVASGLTLIFGIMDVVNFAHGELFMLGAYMGTTVLVTTGSFWLALPRAPGAVARPCAAREPPPGAPSPPAPTGAPPSPARPGGFGPPPPGAGAASPPLGAPQKPPVVTRT